MLIGLHGKARSGKDTACKFIQEVFEGARRDAFADRLKWSAYRLFDPICTLEEATEWADWFKTQGEVEVYDSRLHGVKDECTGREFLQRYGTEAHREIFATDFWVDACLPKDHDHSKEILIITDVRFPNEAQRIRDLGGEVWHILRTRNVDMSDTHASEIPLPAELIDYTLFNDRSLDHLRDLAVSRVERAVEAMAWLN